MAIQLHVQAFEQTAQGTEEARQALVEDHPLDEVILIAVAMWLGKEAARFMNV